MVREKFDYAAAVTSMHVLSPNEKAELYETDRRRHMRGDVIEVGAELAPTLDFLRWWYQTFDDEGLYLRGYVYVMQFDQGWVKIGASSNLARRIAEHRDGICRRHALTIERIWVSPPTLEPRHFEARLKEILELTFTGDLTPPSVGAVKARQPTERGQGQSDMYRGVDFERLLQQARTLPYDEISDAALDTLREDRLASQTQRQQVRGRRQRTYGSATIDDRQSHKGASPV